MRFQGSRQAARLAQAAGRTRGAERRQRRRYRRQQGASLTASCSRAYSTSSSSFTHSTLAVTPSRWQQKRSVQGSSCSSSSSPLLLPSASLPLSESSNPIPKR